MARRIYERRAAAHVHGHGQLLRLEHIAAHAHVHAHAHGGIAHRPHTAAAVESGRGGAARATPAAS